MDYSTQTMKGPFFRALNYRGSKKSAITVCKKTWVLILQVETHEISGGFCFFSCIKHIFAAQHWWVHLGRLWWLLWPALHGFIWQVFVCSCIIHSWMICFSRFLMAVSQICRKQRHTSFNIYYVLSHKNGYTNWNKSSVQNFLTVNV